MAVKKEKKKKSTRKPRSLHDEVVKSYFSDIETARSFFTEYLPADIVKSLDFNTLRICKDSFLDKTLAKYFSDILYQATLNNIDIFIYLLIDHKSREEPFMGFQFLKYMVRIWELHLKQNKKAENLPVIIPIVIYHGPKKWEVDTGFTSFFNAPGYLKEYIPDFNYKLYDISHVPDEEIKGAVLLRVLFMTLKYLSTPGLNYKLREEIFPLFLELEDKKKGTEYLEVLLSYLVRSAGSLPEKELKESVRQLFEEGGDLMETIAEKWKREGKREGMEKKAKETAKRMLEDGLPIETILKYTGLTEKKIKELMS
ncbi:MAG: Rpn family recombination-promoting nuclease/putative transposase [Candidatus Aminicenantes bacterium]|jgi:predicted transposase/invertase (TIGR01784 family)